MRPARLGPACAARLGREAARSNTAPPGMAGIRRRSVAGFSLIEVLVAVAVFALTSALAYGGLRTLVDAQVQEAGARARLGQLQFAVGLLERDVTSAARRGVRDNYGAPRPVLEGGGERLELTRHGLANALALPRAELERLAWLRRDDRLLRLRWPVLDRAPGTVPVEDVLLDGVERLDLVFLDARGREHRQWPPRGVTEALPRAVRLKLELRDYGELVRVLELPREPTP